MDPARPAPSEDSFERELQALARAPDEHPDGGPPLLAAGQRVGPYEIAGLLARGGMGQVFRARDERLGREVAIKILPAELRADEKRLQRFAQEVRAAGALNHANLLTIYDVGSHQGLPYLVSELLRGETLRDLLARGPLPPRRAVDVAVQIARGLAAAHDRGIVHRDLKPENLFVTRDGDVKILDFGLAKLIAAPSAGGHHLTDSGTILGTAGYMAPEQVRGEPVDHRADLFSFGAVLYELLSGHRAFRGGSGVATLHAILAEDPPELSREAVPVALGRVVFRCLEKSAGDRFQSARDVAFALEALAPSGSGERAPAFFRWRTLRIAALQIAVAAIAAAAAAFGVRSFTARGVPQFEQISFRRGTIRAARFGPGGQGVYYGGAWDGRPAALFAAGLAGHDAKPLGTAGELLSVSRSGALAVLVAPKHVDQWIVQGTLAEVRAGGGEPRELLEDAQWADWAPNGKSLAVVRAVGGRHRLEFPIGNLLVESKGWLSHPRVSPAGDEIAVWEHERLGDDAGSLLLVAANGRRRVLSADWFGGGGLAWSPRGDEVWFTATRSGARRSLYAIGRGGGSERLLHGGAGSITLHDAAADGRLLATLDQERWGVLAHLDGRGEADLSWLDGSVARDLSRDGKALLFSEVAEAGGDRYAAYLRRLDADAAVIRLGDGAAAALSPDGSLALARTVGTDPALVLLPTQGGPPRRLANPLIAYFGAAWWFPDAQRVLFWGTSRNAAARTYVQSLDGEPRALTPEGVIPYGAGNPLSPDGRSVVVGGPDGRVFRWEIEGGTHTAIEGLQVPEQVIRWSEDGRELYVFRHGDVPAVVHRLDLVTGKKTVWRTLGPPDLTGVQHVCPIVITPDAKSHAFTFMRYLSELYVITGI